VLAGGLVALAVTVCLVQWWASTSGDPGPGRAAVVGHVLAALGAVVLQLVAERCRGRTATLAAWCIVTLAAAVLWFGWWT
jgi:hypothetical protein